VPGCHTDVTGLTADESRALFVSRSGSTHADLGLGPALGSALRKAMSALPAPYPFDADLARRRVLIDPPAGVTVWSWARGELLRRRRNPAPSHIEGLRCLTIVNTEHQIATSVLVVGTGGAGLRAAIELAERGVDVLAVGKRPKADAHTTLAAGGINAAALPWTR
jgi:hypothetical protein